MNVQRMVFGIKGERSSSGVAFSWDEITGVSRPSGDFLSNAQGEDIVSGVRTPRDLGEMAAEMPHAHAEPIEILATLERHYGDMQDTECTVEEGRQVKELATGLEAGLKADVIAHASGGETCRCRPSPEPAPVSVSEPVPATAVATAATVQ